MSYEQLDQQDKESKNAINFLPKTMRDAAVAQSQDPNDPTIIKSGKPERELSWQQGLRLESAAKHASDLTHKNLIPRLRRAQQMAAQGRKTSEFTPDFQGLGMDSSQQIAAKLAVGAAGGLVNALTGGGADAAKLQEEEMARKKQANMALIFGGISLVLLAVLLFKMG